MDFSAYKAKGEFATPAQNRLTPLSVTYNNAGEQALARTQGGIGNALIQGGMAYLDFRAKANNGKVMEANSEYNRLMSEGCAELLQNKEERALDTVDKFEELHRKTVDKLRKDYGKYIMRGEGARAFDVYTERDYVSRRDNMVKYQIAQTEAFENTQFNNQLATTGQLAMDSGGGVDALKMAEERIATLCADRYYQRFGQERVDAEQRKAMQELIGLGVKSAISLSDYDKLNDIVQAYGQYMDAGTRVAAGTQLGKRQRETLDMYEADSFYNKFGRYATYEQILEEVKAQAGGSGAGSVDAEAQKLLGVEMANGRNGCVEFAMRALSGLSSFVADNAGEVNVGRITQLAKDAGRLERYSGGNIKSGDIVVYANQGDDVENFDNLMHVVVSDGQGGYYGNSSSARDYTDDNGQYVKGNGCGVHQESLDIGGFEIAYVIHTDATNGKAPAMSELEQKEKADRIYKAISERRTLEERAEKGLIDQGMLEQQALLNQLVQDPEQYDAIAYKYATDANGAINERVLQSLLQQGAHRRQAILNDMKRSAGGSSSGGGASGGGDSANSYQMVDMVRKALKDGVDHDSLAEFIVNSGAKNQASLFNEIENYQKGKGFFAMPTEGMKARLKADTADSVDKGSFDFQYGLAENFAYSKYQEFMKNNDGRTPTEEQIYSWMVEGIAQPTYEDNSSLWSRWFGASTEGVGMTRGELFDRGATDMGKNPNGAWYITLKNGETYTISEDQKERIMAGESARSVVFGG